MTNKLRVSWDDTLRDIERTSKTLKSLTDSKITWDKLAIIDSIKEQLAKVVKE